MKHICVDIGNSGMRCVLLKSPWDDSSPWTLPILRVDWNASEMDPVQTALRVAQSIDDWLRPLACGSPCIWLVSSVQRTMQSILEACVAKRAGDCLKLISYQDLNLQVDVDQPDKVGVDRLLAAYAAAHCFPNQELIVVQAGSAITVDLLKPPNQFCGGAIMPGVPMMLRLLSKAADLLPEVAANELLELPPVPGRNTSAAMAAGVSSAVVGGVQHLIQRYRAARGHETLVVLSGGDGPKLSPHTPGPYKVVDQLVLRGLALRGLALGGTGMASA